MSDPDGPIKQRISYKQPPISLYNISNILGSSAIVRPVSRIDYWEDGSASTTFYLEISADQYDILSLDGKPKAMRIAVEPFTPEQVSAIQKMIAEMAIELEERWAGKTHNSRSETFQAPAPFGS